MARVVLGLALGAGGLGLGQHPGGVSAYEAASLGLRLVADVAQAGRLVVDGGICESALKVGPADELADLARPPFTHPFPQLGGVWVISGLVLDVVEDEVVLLALEVGGKDGGGAGKGILVVGGAHLLAE